MEDLDLLVPALLEKIKFVRGYSREFQPDAIQLLKRKHYWPGNARELTNFLFNFHTDKHRFALNSAEIHMELEKWKSENHGPSTWENDT